MSFDLSTFDFINAVSTSWLVSSPMAFTIVYSGFTVFFLFYCLVAVVAWLLCSVGFIQRTIKI